MFKGDIRLSTNEAEAGTINPKQNVPYSTMAFLLLVGLNPEKKLHNIRKNSITNVLLKQKRSIWL